jgi:hypothetical protein
VPEDRPRKIALIGATGYEYGSPEARVECFTWDRLKKADNLADYDVLVLNLLSVEDMGSLDADAIGGALSVRTMLEVLAADPVGSSDGAIFVLGDPRGNIVEAPSDTPADLHDRYEVPFLFWTGMEFRWDERRGDTIERTWEATHGSFNPFADKLGHWRYSLEACEANSYEFDELLPMDKFRQDGYQLKAIVEDICKSRYHTSIVFRVRLVVADGNPRRVGRMVRAEETMPLTGPICFLPKSEFTEEETLEFVLRDLCGVDVSTPEPEWIQEISVPGQEHVDQEISELENRIEELIGEHERKLDDRAKLRRPLELLYQSGAALEEIVWIVLQELGAEVEVPEDRANEDGWITVQVGDQIFEGVLEIKGIKGRHFNLEGLRASANRLATFCTCQLSGRFRSLPTGS